MRHRRILALPIAAALLAFAPVVHACSVTNDYRVPTNLELAGQADAIVKAKVVGEMEGDNFWDRAMTVEIIEVVKGDEAELAAGGTLTITGGGLVPDDDPRGYGLLSNPYEFAEAHPTSYAGACIRHRFPRGTTALFFLDRGEDGAWNPGGGPFSRWAEDVIGDEDEPWMVLARLYATASAMDAEAGRAALQTMRQRLLLVDDPVMRLMAADIARQLEGPNKAWNRQMYELMAAEEEAAADSIADQLMDETGEMAEEAMLIEEGEDGYSLSATIELPGDDAKADDAKASAKSDD